MRPTTHLRYLSSPPSDFFRPNRLVAGLLSLSLLSCGAATALDFDPPTKDSETPANATPDSKDPDSNPGRGDPKSSSGGGGRGNPQSGVDLPTFELPDCKLGALPNTVKECPFLADGHCYENVESACACVCPRDVETFCFEGLFLNIWNGVDVWCSER